MCVYIYTSRAFIRSCLRMLSKSNFIQVVEFYGAKLKQNYIRLQPLISFNKAFYVDDMEIL
jgi:hypothetical protein